MKKQKKLILAKGEHTGHKHVLTATKDAFIEVLDSINENLNYLLEGEAKLTHEEHNPVMYRGATYTRRYLVEVDPFTNELRAVID